MTDSEPTRVAIGCQGGGSHAAFGAGALKEFLRQPATEYEIVALSGTSGGAICATLAWYALLDGDRERGVELLDEFWTDVTTESFPEQIANETFVRWLRLDRYGVPLPSVSPYDTPMARWANQWLETLLQKYIPFDEIEALEEPILPRLHVGAVNISDNNFRVFRGNELTPDVLLASAAVPPFFRAVEIDGNRYWDGLLSENPPVRPLPRSNPDELWIVQVNPRHRREEPRSLPEIADRRNELAGNLSLEQDLRAIEDVNELIEEGVISHEDYSRIGIHRLVLDRDFDHASKFDRSRRHITALAEYGEEAAAEFLRERS